jgi:hypothetical protein
MASHMDVLGISFWLPDPDSAEILARNFGAVATNIAASEDQLKALRSPQAWAEWTGHAAGAFASRLGQLPGQLGQAHESYASVAAALSSYAAGLRPVVSRLVTLSQEAEGTESTLRTATAELSSARHSGDHPAASYWEARVYDLTDEVSSLRRQVQSQVADMDELSRRCAQQIGKAAPGSHSNVLSDLWHGTEKVGDYTGHLLYHEFVQPFSDYSHAVAAFLEHPDDHTFGELLGSLGGVLGVLVLAAGVVAFGAGLILSGGTLGVALAGVAEVADLTDAVGEVAMVMDGGALVSDVAAVATHDPGATGQDVVDASLSVVADGGGAVLGHEEDQLLDDSGLGTGVAAGLKTAGDDFYSVSTGLQVSAAEDAMEHLVSVPVPAAAGTPDVAGGLNIASGAVHGLQGLPPAAPQGGADAGVFQPAASPATVNVQHVAFSLQPSAAPGSAPISSGTGM